MQVDREKPAIIIGVLPGDGAPTGGLLHGIEEEEIPVRTQELDFDDPVARAYQAALASRLSVGIAIAADRIVVHYANLHEDRPLFDESATSETDLRILGANAARLVKGIPFKTKEK